MHSWIILGSHGEHYKHHNTLNRDTWTGDQLYLMLNHVPSIWVQLSRKWDHASCTRTYKHTGDCLLNTKANWIYMNTKGTVFRRRVLQLNFDNINQFPHSKYPDRKNRGICRWGNRTHDLLRALYYLVMLSTDNGIQNTNLYENTTKVLVKLWSNLIQLVKCFIKKIYDFIETILWLPLTRE